ncbi:MAG: ABC transporter ATP-binding protein [Nitrososphaerales archaeon]
MSIILEVKELSKYFGGLRALNNVSLEVKEKELLGLIGPNGAGKTTLFNIICGDFKPSNGIIKFYGENITNLKPYERCKKGIARTYQLVKPFLNLTVFQNVMIGVLFGREKCDRKVAVKEAEKAIDLVGLHGKHELPVKELSVLDRKKVELARAVSASPKLLLLDEPVAGLNPKETEELMGVIETVRKDGMTIFMIEHVLKILMNHADRIVVLHHGQKIAEGSPMQVTNDRRVIEAYIGAPPC